MKIFDSHVQGIVIPVSDTMLLPGVTTMIRVSSLSDEELKNIEQESRPLIALPLKQNFSRKRLNEEDFYQVGVTFAVTRTEKSDKGVTLRARIMDRVEIRALDIRGDVIYAEYESASDERDLTDKSREDLLGYVKKVLREIGEKFAGADQFMKAIEDMREINPLIVYLSQFMPLSNSDKYDLLETRSQGQRSLKFIDHLLKQKESIELQIQLAEKFSQKANKSYRESVLREQMKAIQEELSEGKGGGGKDKEYLARIEKAGMPPDIKTAALEELDKLTSQGPNSPDYNVIRNYLDLLVALPWKKSEQKPFDLNEARRILNEQHYGLDKVKERIIQHLAVMQLKKDKKGSILLLVGPPGTGKTSLGKSIAQALGRQYIRLSLGGIRDEAEIRGHRRTYVGAMPGRILQSMKKAGENDPVMVLDEVDKLMSGGYSGDPSSALLEVLDPEQNNSFTDHYLDLPYDLSQVFFIATANTTESIPAPLLDRMEVITISGYTPLEKFHIGKNHLIPGVLCDHGLTEQQLVIHDDVLRRIIAEFTAEAGVRGLKKQLAAIARCASEKIVSGKAETPYAVKAEDLEEILGKQVSRHDKAQADNPPGVVTGLAWTPVGGEILFIEASDMAGSGQVILTGQLGDVMKESAGISLSLLKSRLPVNSVNFKERDLHIHVPSGAVPKDGPSAGIALFTALASLVTGIKVDSRIAMTGEITLRGCVLPIGGLKEKLMGAQRAGITRVLIPADNAVDLKDVPEEILKDLTVKTVETVEDVLKETLGFALPRIEHMFLTEALGGAICGPAA
jgi:ATP-dependent Lon protease